LTNIVISFIISEDFFHTTTQEKRGHHEKVVTLPEKGKMQELQKRIRLHTTR